MMKTVRLCLPEAPSFKHGGEKQDMRRTVLFLSLILVLIPVWVRVPAAAEMQPYGLQLNINGSEKTVRAMDGSYKGNIFLSLTDLADALRGTEKQFRFERIVSSTDGEVFSVRLGQESVLASGAENMPSHSAVVPMNLTRNRLQVDGEERKYYSFNPQNGDLYLSITDVQLMLNLNFIFSDHGSFALRTEEDFAPDPFELEKEGFFDGIGSICLADANSGRVLYHRSGQTPVPIASLTKLLSYVVLKDAVRSGEITENDSVRISAGAEEMSLSGDGMVVLKEGETVPFRELLEAMLIASSNESALALAEHLCGDEGSFVARMYSKAEELGIQTAKLYNCHGLPSYTDGNIPIKRQNMMSVDDLFILIRYILSYYPEITEITSLKLGHMPSLNDYWTANSNPLIYNMEGVNGLKTGHTDRAGYCIAVSIPFGREGDTHTVVLVLTGAESAALRGQAAEILLHYAGRVYGAL